MKTKHILSTAAVFAGLISGAVLTTQTVDAQSTTSGVTQKASEEKKDEIGSVSYVHYNVLRAYLKTPVSTTDYYLAFSVEGMHHKGTAVIENGKYIGFDLKLDELIKEYPTVSDREKLFDALFIRSFPFTAHEPVVTTKVTNKDIKKELLDYHFLGNVLGDGFAGETSNLTHGSSFNKFFTQERVAGDHLLDNGNITTETGGLEFSFNPEMEADYTYALTDASGKIAGKAWSVMDYFFVNPTDGERFLPKEYTLTAKSNKTGAVYTLAKFTPISIF